MRSTDEVARILEIHPSRVRRLATRHGIGRKVGDRAWVFGPDEVAALRAKSNGPRKPGRPPNPAARPDRDAVPEHRLAGEGER